MDGAGSSGAPDVPADDMRRNELSDFNASEA